MRRTSLAALLILALTSGCGADDSGGETRDTDVATAPAVSKPVEPEPSGVVVRTRPCGLLSSQQIADQLGEAVGAGQTFVDQHDYPTCRLGALPVRRLDMTAVPASWWAEEELVYEIGDEYSSLLADHPRLLEVMASAVDGRSSLSDDEACQVFVALATTDVVVFGTPDMQAPESLTGYGCRDGVFAALHLVRPDLSASRERVAAVERGVETILERASDQS